MEKNRPVNQTTFVYEWQFDTYKDLPTRTDQLQTVQTFHISPAITVMCSI